MSQNIYDDTHFFEDYAQLNRSVYGLDGAPEWPALFQMLPDLKNLNIVDLGCGYGWFCKKAYEMGATQITGIDVSEKMIAKARTMASTHSINYQITDMEQLLLPESTFNLAYSSLTLHYIKNILELLKNIYNSLIPGGHFVFSVEHPIYTASKNPGWIMNQDGLKSWPIDNYQNESDRTTDWLSKRVIKQHRTIGTYLNLLIKEGFTISHVEEWKPTDKQIAINPELLEECERPMLLLVSAYR